MLLQKSQTLLRQCVLLLITGGFLGSPTVFAAEISAETLWRTETNTTIFPKPRIDGDVIYYATGAGGIVALKVSGFGPPAVEKE